jgi:hypothetical protein
MNTWDASALPAIATALLAALCLAFGSLHPELNYDVVPYAALAKEMRGAGGKATLWPLLTGSCGFLAKTFNRPCFLFA